MKTKRREWVPVGPSQSAGSPSQGVSLVKRWVWTPAQGLMVTYKDGLTCESGWKTLRNFLAAIKSGREHAKEITP